MIVPVYLAVAQPGVLFKLLMKNAQTDGTCEHVTDNNILIFSNTQGDLAQRKNLDI